VAAPLDFIGYGSSDPIVIFLGIEEKDAGGGQCALGVRQEQFAAIEDLVRGCNLLSQCPGFVNPFAPGARTVVQWNMASRFRLALADRPWTSEWDHHWRTYLGRNGTVGEVDGDTLLMECFPEPATGLNVVRERERQWPARRLVLRRFLADTAPRFVIAYGTAPGKYVEELFPVVESIYGESIDSELVGTWHQLSTRRPASIAVSVTGAVIARVAFFGTGQFNVKDVETIASSMVRLGGGAAPLRHEWV